MIFVEKNNSRAISLVSKFLNGQWQKLDTKYVNISYDNLDGSTKSSLKQYCLEEQDNVCCYCSKTISIAEATLEHIIPRSVCDISNLQEYTKLSNILEENICLQSEFTNSKLQREIPPYPLEIAYHNLLASCDGTVTHNTSKGITCNLSRGNEFLPPFNLINGSIEYLKDGTIYYVKDSSHLQSYFNKNNLNLNYETLKNIRRIWCVLAKSNVEYEEIESVDDSNINEFFTIYFECSPEFNNHFDREIGNTYKIVEQFHNTLVPFNYFLNWYRK